MLEGIAAVRDDGEFFACERLAFDWRAAVPPGFHVQQADAALFERAELRNVDRVAGWAKSNFGSIPAFLTHGFALCTLHGDAIVSWSVCDCVSGGRCEIGIHTDERYRRRGFATLTAAAAVDHALTQGFKSVGWHCVRPNVGSSATARKLGFTKVQDYHAFRVCIAELDNHVINGNLALLRGEFDVAAQCFGKALRAAEARPVGAVDSKLLTTSADRARYHFEAACASALAGDRASALRSLSAAIEASTLRQKGY
jgi:RimJ/RimL family protein N-acetyltransferase